MIRSKHRVWCCPTIIVNSRGLESLPWYSRNMDGASYGTFLLLPIQQAQLSSSRGGAPFYSLLTVPIPTEEPTTYGAGLLEWGSYC